MHYIERTQSAAKQQKNMSNVDGFHVHFIRMSLHTAFNLCNIRVVGLKVE